MRWFWPALLLALVFIGGALRPAPTEAHGCCVDASEARAAVTEGASSPDRTDQAPCPANECGDCTHGDCRGCTDCACCSTQRALVYSFGVTSVSDAGARTEVVPPLPPWVPLAHRGEVFRPPRPFAPVG